MTHERRDNPIDDAALSAGASLRLAADGELSPERERGVASGDEALRRVAFERSLRAAVGRAMQDDGATDELRRRIEGVVRARAGSAGVLGVVRRNWSLAAMIIVAIGLAAIYMGRLGAPTAQQRRAMGVMASMLNDEAERYTGFGEAFEKHVPFKGTADAAAGMTSIVGVAVPVKDLSSLGLEVAGLAPCSLPWKGRSGQLIYRRPGGDGWVSLIMNALPAGVPESTRLPVDAVFRIEPERGRDDAPVFMWREGDVVFYLVAPDADAARRALPALGAPSVERPFTPSGLPGEQYRTDSSTTEG